MHRLTDSVVGEKGNPMKRSELIKDLEYCEEVMIRLGDRSDIWQDRTVYGLAKVLRDLLLAKLKEVRDAKD